MPAERTILRVHAALLIAAVLFSANYILVKIAVREISPLAFAWVRAAGASALLLAIRLRRHQRPLHHYSGTERFQLVGLAIIGIAANQILFVSGLARTTAHMAAILITSIPIFALLLALALRHERPTAARIGGIGAAALGAGFIIGFPETHPSGSSAVTGNVLILLNCASYGSYLVLSRRFMQKFRPLRVMTDIFLIGTVLMIPFCARAVLSESWAAVSLGAWLSLAAVIAGPTVGAYMLNAWSLVRADSSLVAAYTYLQPLFASLLAVAFLSETIAPEVAFAGLLIVGGVWLCSRAGVNERAGQPSNRV